MKKIANIVNFVRSVEPRETDDAYLFNTLKEELRLCRRYGMKNTVLLQYDALILPEYRALLREYEDLVEPGLWLEIVRPLAEAAGIPWAGRYVWDWTGGVNYLAHDTPEERSTLLDRAFGTFRAHFGFYPRVVGCWTMDSFSLRYMEETWGISAACICRDQYGTDYTTLWGGVYNGGYYPCKNNILCPANTKAAQIGAPVFRMLGPDPVRQYDMGLGEPEKPQTVCTLEPVYPGGGGSETWVRRYLKENYNDKCLSHAYAQFGQENSFGWESIRRGLPMQLKLLDEAVKAGRIELMTLGETGVWYRNSFETTPPVAMCTDDNGENDDTRSVWYASRFYRANLLYRDGTVWFRDIHRFDENYRSDDLDEPNRSPETGYFDLPVVDGFRWSKGDVRAGLFLEKDGAPLRFDAPFESRAAGETEIAVTAAGFSARFTEAAILLRLPEGTALVLRAASVPWLPIVGHDEKTLRFSFSGFVHKPYGYALTLGRGRFDEKDGVLRLLPEDGAVRLDLKGG